jgi:hypothetical protein
MPSDVLENLARAIHERYLLQIKGREASSPKSSVDWKDLSPELKASNKAAARRIYDILAAMGLTLEQGRATPAERVPVGKIIRNNIDMLAGLEHEGWMDDKRLQGWTFGKKRDDARQKHPLLIPYGDLPESEKEKDRDSIRQYPKRVAEAGYKIVFKKSAR